ncbi:DUF2789 domain-containing protein [Enterovibrio makurazakiensis]|uniref:DUF2789 domain-containing protein n=1 Tax=Enterovibrio gelatinilyticus TaxID=2899819 RepID=A0ABT5R4M2_9GAMM|nr:DUF2789 family protein [Enterovibrio sp. ZSDZ42]MDD1795232.1 DUF2789 domain-containing protein [Enterovibrio sp. ZSDZ42]
MEVFEHDLEHLFQQLGLSSDAADIRKFIEEHGLSDDDNLLTATFWTTSQRQFLDEAKSQDADWAEQIDILDTLLRKG